MANVISVALNKRDDKPPQEVVIDPDTFEGEIETMIRNTLAANLGSSNGVNRLAVNNGTAAYTNGTAYTVNLVVTGDEGRLPRTGPGFSIQIHLDMP